MFYVYSPVVPGSSPPIGATENLILSVERVTLLPGVLFVRRTPPRESMAVIAEVVVDLR